MSSSSHGTSQSTAASAAANSAGGSTAPKPDLDLLKDWMDSLSKTPSPRNACSKLIMNFLVTEGFKDAADKFNKESGLPLSGTDVSLSLEERIRIRDSIHQGEILHAKNQLDKLHPKLLPGDESLLFRMQQQHLIELIREKKTEEVLKFAQSEFGPKAEENSPLLTELERTLALLAFDNPSASPFGDLLNVSHRQKVASEVNAAILEMDGVESTVPSLVVVLHTLLWAQEQLDKKKVLYPKLTDISEATFEAPPM